jgi:hypothetical protein
MPTSAIQDSLVVHCLFNIGELPPPAGEDFYFALTRELAPYDYAAIAQNANAGQTISINHVDSPAGGEKLFDSAQTFAPASSIVRATDRFTGPTVPLFFPAGEEFYIHFSGAALANMRVDVFISFFAPTFTTPMASKPV